MLLVSCLARQGGNHNGCLSVYYRDSTEDFKIIKKLVFDTTASLVHATITDAHTKRLLSDATMQLAKIGEKLMVRASKGGRALVFRNGIEGYSDITFSAPGYSCLTIKRFEIGGGQILSVRLRKRK